MKNLTKSIISIGISAVLVTAVANANDFNNSAMSKTGSVAGGISSVEACHTKKAPHHKKARPPKHAPKHNRKPDHHNGPAKPHPGLKKGPGSHPHAAKPKKHLMEERVVPNQHRHPDNVVIHIDGNPDCHCDKCHALREQQYELRQGLKTAGHVVAGAIILGTALSALAD